MWTIGRSQRVEEKKYRPIVRKIRYIMKVKCTMYQKENKIINVYRFTLQELSTRIEEYDALKKSTLFQSMHKIIFDIKYYVYLKF